MGKFFIGNTYRNFTTFLLTKLTYKCCLHSNTYELLGRVNFSYNFRGSLHFDQIKFSLFACLPLPKASTGLLCFLVYPKMAHCSLVYPKMAQIV